MILEAFARADHPGPPPSKGARQPTSCVHTGRKRFVWRPAKTGGRRYGFQCLTCGRFPNIRFRPAWVGEKRCHAVHGRYPDEAVEGEDALTDRLQAVWNAKVAAAYAAYKSASASDRLAWRNWYAAYLASFAWTKKRGEVLARDGYACKFCGAPAGQVHHLTYDNVSHEDLADLVSVCRACHEQEHGIENAC